MDEGQLRIMIQDTLKPLGIYSEDAEELLMLTMAVESHLGEYVMQVRGPAQGIFQMEKDTELDIHNNWLHYREDMANKVYALMTMSGSDLKYNLQYQVVMARIHYLRASGKIPSRDDLEGLANYWKVHYNSIKGKGTVAKAMEKYDYYIE